MAADSDDAIKAISHFEEALKLNSESIGAYLGLVRVVNDVDKVKPYVDKINFMPIAQVLDYIRSNTRIIGNLERENNLLTIAVHTIRSEELVEGILDIGINGDAKNALIHYVDKFKNANIVKK